MNLYVYLFIFSVFVASLSQILLKKSALTDHKSFIKEYLNPLVIIAYTLFLFSTVVVIIAYKEIPVSIGVILESSGYIFVSILSYVFLKETLNIKQCFGLILILLGIFVCNINYFI